jgi:hypothetical protein
VLDSCRDNPLADQLRRSIGASRALPLQRDLARIDGPEGMIIAYATQAGRTADDGHGRNSPYTTAFLKHIDEKEEIGSIFRRISNDVYETTKHEQLPELSLSLIGEFYLNGKLQIPVAPTSEPSAEASRDVTSQLRTRVGMPFNAADAPFMCDKCREDLGNGIAGKPGHSAVVLSFDGGSFWSFGKATTAEARKIALAQCLNAGRLACFVYAIDGQITWAEPSPPLPIKPWFKRDPQIEQPIDFQKVPNIYDGDRPRIAQLYSRIKGKAVAVGPFLQWTITGKADSDEEAARVVLERCAHVTHVPCRVIALGNSLVVPLTSLEAWPTAAPAMPSAINATGPVYAPSGPVVLPSEIPFICDDCRDQVGKALSEERLHTAVVISLAGGFWIVGGCGTAEEARTVALGRCLGSDSLTCFVYALDGQMVWEDNAPPMPTTPWFTHDATIERPLDVAALPGFSISAKQFIRDFYSPVKTPKAIAAGDGTFAVGFGLRYPAHSENEAARLVLERCGYITQAPCRIIAIGESSVVKSDAN